MTHHRMVSPAGVGAAVPTRAEAPTQTQLQITDAALQAPGCSECLGPLWYQEKWTSVLQKLCSLGEAVSPSGGVTGGSEEAAQHPAAEKIKGR